TASADRLRRPAPRMSRVPGWWLALRRSSARRRVGIGGRQLVRGQQDGDLGALAEFAVDPDGPPVGKNDALAQREAEADAGAGGLGSEKWIEHPLQMLARDANAIVDHANDDERMVTALAARFVLGDHANGAAFALGRIGGVVQQVEQHLLNLVFVGKCRP